MMGLDFEKNCFFVSISGDDRNPGTFDLPFATFEKAKLEARRFIKQNETGITIYVRQGTYYFQEPLVFHPEDSGSEQNPIKFEAYPDEDPVLSGGQRISKRWKSYRDGIWICEIPDVIEKNLDFTQLFINGKRQIRARYPNYDPAKPGVTGYIYPAETELTWPHTEFQYNPETFTTKKWAKPHEAVLHIFGMNYWGNLQWEISDIDWHSHTIKLGKGGFQINDLMQGQDATGIDHRSRFFIENVFEELDSPGEWYLDKEIGILFVYPEAGIDLNNALIEAPILKQVIEFKGEQANPVHHITFSGFRIAHTRSTFFEEYEATSLGDWTIAISTR